MDVNKILLILRRDEKVELHALRSKELSVFQIINIRSELSRDIPVECPYCHSLDIYNTGTEHTKGGTGINCKSCQKTFNDLTETGVPGIKKIYRFQEYLKMVIESTIIRKASTKLHFNMKTIFDW